MNGNNRSKRGKTSGNVTGMRSIATHLSKVMQPVLARRTGMTLDLITAWPELVGETFSTTTLPEKIDWPRRAHEDDPFQPATLVVACDGSAALFFQHEMSLVLERVNQFFGFEAIRRIRIIQKPVVTSKPRQVKKLQQMTKEETARLAEILAGVEDPDLRQILEKFGEGVVTRQTKDQ